MFLLNYLLTYKVYEIEVAMWLVTAKCLGIIAGTGASHPWQK